MRLLRSRGAAPRWLPWLLLSLVLAAWLAALHPIVHLRPDPGGSHSHDTGHLKDLLGRHGSAEDCLVFDQLHHGDALPAAEPVRLPLACPAQPRVAGPVRPGRAPELAFRARAPPAIRSLA